MESLLRPNDRRAKNAITLIWIILTLEIISLISGYLQYDLLNTAANGGEISIESANSNDNREQIIGIVYSIVYIISAVMFIQWFRRAYFNLHQITNTLKYKEGWAAGAWFVPVLSLFRPYQIMKDLFIKTKEYLSVKNLDNNNNLSTEIIGWWWTLWIANNFLSQVVVRYSMRAETIDELTNMTLANIFLNIFGIPLALIAIKMIKNYSSVESLLVKSSEEDQIDKIDTHNTV